MGLHFYPLAIGKYSRPLRHHSLPRDATYFYPLCHRKLGFLEPADILGDGWDLEYRHFIVLCWAGNLTGFRNSLMRAVGLDAK